MAHSDTPILDALARELGVDVQKLREALLWAMHEAEVALAYDPTMDDVIEGDDGRLSPHGDE